MFVKASSDATSHATGMTSGAMPPCASSGSGARRVQITNPSGAGAPDATPRLKGVARHFDCARMIDGAATRAAPAAMKWRRGSIAAALTSDVEAEQQHVAVLHDIVLAFGPHLASVLGPGFAAELHEIVVGDGLRADEASLEVRVDLARGFGGLRASVSGPGAGLLGAGRE